MSGVVCGAVVPHAPLLLPEAVGEQVAGETEALRRTIASLAFHEASVIVVLSPHAEASGVYGTIEGSLKDFSIAGVEVHQPSDPTTANMLANFWGKPVLEGPVDHGVLVPLKLLAATDKPVIAAGIRDTDWFGRRLDKSPGADRSVPSVLGLEGPGAGATLGQSAMPSDGAGMGGAGQAPPDGGDEDLTESVVPGGAIGAGTSFARALLQFASNRPVAFVATAHTSSALLPRAPLTELAEAKPTEAAVLDALRSDPAHLETWLMDLWIRGGSCSLATWAAYSEVFGGRASELLAYEYPFGVGYVVARVS